jgi:DNA repair exonuclease SbcCD ATPase subunit
MILLRTHISGFGKLSDVRIDFKSGLNLIFAHNEGGKSTLQQAIMGLLYGQLRADLRMQRRPDAWVDRYRPWNGREYGGILWCRLADGREIEIHRSFGREETRFEIRGSSGEDITGNYDHQRNGEVLFAATHLGIPKGLYESVGVIRENRVAEIDGYETIRDRVANLAQSGNEELSVRRSLGAIQAALDDIGSERAPTRPYRQTTDRVQALRAERKAASERRGQFYTWIEERNRLAGEIKRLEQELGAARHVLFAAQKQELLGRVRSLEEIRNDLERLNSSMELLDADPEFPVGRLEELNRFEGAYASLEKRLMELRTAAEAAGRELALAEAERRELELFALQADGTEAEKVTEWFVTFLSLSLQKDGVQKTILRLAAEAETVEKRLKDSPFSSLDPDTDWQRLAREAAEDEQAAARDGAALAEKTMQVKTALAEVRRTARSRRLLAAAMLAPAVAIPLTGTENGFGFPLYVSVIAGVVFLAVAGVLFLLAGKSTATVHRLRKELADLDVEEKRVIEEGGRKRQRLNEVTSASGFRKIEDFLNSITRYEDDRRRYEEIAASLEEARRNRERFVEQAEDYYGRVKENLAGVGLTCSPGNLKFQIDVYRANMRRFRERDVRHKSCVGRSESLMREAAALAAELDEKRVRIDSLLGDAGVDTPEQFRRECSRRNRLMELLGRKESMTREYNRLAGDRSLTQWQEELRQLIEQAPQTVEAVPVSPSPNDPNHSNNPNNPNPHEVHQPAPLLPYTLTVSEAERQEKECASRLAAVREEFAGAAERVRQAFHDVRPSFEIDEDLAVAERSLRELEQNRAALATAFDTIEELSRQHQEVLAPQLNAAVEQRFLRICGRGYEEVKIDPDFQLWVREIGTGKLRPAEQLSRGAQDQIYLALRFGILDLVADAAEPCPCLLDEPFAAYDRLRLRDALEVVREEAERRQLLLFTCKDEMLDPALRLGANIIRLD